MTMVAAGSSCTRLYLSYDTGDVEYAKIRSVLASADLGCPSCGAFR